MSTLVKSRLTLRLQTLVDTFFPRYCVVCHRRLHVGETYLCASCLVHLPLTHIKGRKNNLVERLLWDEHVRIERASCLLFYEKASDYREIFFAFKYFGKPRLALYLGTLIARDLLDTNFFERIDALLPVPLARRRLRERGYNQSEWLARGIARLTGLPIIRDAVERIVSTDTQTHLDQNERRKNVEHIFQAVHSERLKGLHLLLVDDVITTGSTMRALARCVLDIEGVMVSVVGLAVSSYHRRNRFPENFLSRQESSD